MPHGIMAPLPFPPFDPTLPVYAITDNIFLVDATGGQLAMNPRHSTTMSTTAAVNDAAASLATAVVNLINHVQMTQANRQLRAMMRSSGMGVPVPGGGDGGDGGGADYTNSYPTYTFDTNQLWLQITNVADGLANLNLHNATNQVYAIWTTTNLLGDWQVQTELWPALDQTNVLPFTLPTAGQPTLFVRAEDWTGVTENGNTVPDWWFWEYFGTMAFSDTNLDAAGNFLADDYNNQVAPVVFLFSGIEVTNNFVNSPSVPVHLAVSGSPYYAAVLVDDTNFSNAAWNTYSSPEMTVNLGLTQGWHDVRIGLRGHADDATNAVWQWQRVKLDYTPPQLVITNPAGTLVDKPVIQLQGYCSKALIGITYDLSNAAGTVTGQPVLVEGQDYSTNTWEYTTNYFQAYDVPLTNGVNAIALHATDLAGNSTTAHFSFTVDYSGKTNAPAVNLLWPQAGMEIIGSNIVCRGWVSDDTATVTVQLVDANGNASTVGSLVGRDGNFYAGNLTLAAGTNWLTYTVVDAAGNRATTNITFSTSDLGLTLNTVAAGQSVVTGTIDDSSYTVYVNGVQATNDEFGNWSATIAPIGIGGGAVVVNAIQNGGDPTLQQVVDPPQGVFESQYHQKDRQEFIAVGEPYPYLILGGRIDWGDGMGGIEENLGEELTNGVVSESTGGLMSWPGTHWPEPLPNGNSATNMGVPPSLSYWQEHCDVQTSIHQAFWTASTERRTADAEMKLATGGPAGSRQQNLWVLSATATDVKTGLPVPPEQISIGSYGNLETNGNLYVILPDNDPTVVTPKVAGTSYYKFSAPAATKYKLTHQTHYPALTDTNRARLNLGVGEEVDLGGMPSKMVWTGPGLPATTNSGVTFTAPNNACPATVVATYHGLPLPTKFTVLAPTGVDHAKISATNNYPLGAAGAGMQNTVWIAPTFVSFYNVNVMEVGEDATNMWGFFLQWTPQQKHHNTADHWTRLLSDNTLTDAASMRNGGYLPWGAGGYEWNIPQRWQVVSSGVTNSMAGCNQVFSIDANGTARVAKYGNWIQRTTNNVITTN